MLVLLKREKSEIVIVGAGVLGISLAFHLSKLGRSVVILEKENLPCMHASAKNAGMIRQLYKNYQLTDWTERSINSWDEEIRKFFFKQTGSIVVGRTSPPHHEHLFSNIKISFQGQEVSAVYTKTDGLLDSEAYVHYLKQKSLESLNTKIQTNAKVTKLEKLPSGNWQVFTESGASYECELIVNAAGAWLNSFLDCELRMDAQSYVRHLYISSGWESLENKNLPEHGFYWDEVNHWYRRDWAVDQKLISACDVLPSDPDSYQPNSEISYLMADKILSQYPSEGQKIKIGRGWHCFRTYANNQLPIIGFDEKHTNFYRLCAFGGFGMSTSYAATEDAAREIVGI